ncbi:SufE family protein [Bdellovibrio bacteriovorus]|uniref:Regulator of cysteine desulfurase activity n=1 Tax=Bdellovibrio bacteriovorus (strain ATCC 15356 / DSM 50701 / NCIMB 9529 / HD100) TaxID=264462 RepID=Q6MLP6_BDEBA|nr:SufE family protein [Bdellovibrio bacteriovorus]AHZ84458.1 Fe-S metabolism protein SufE [Bdellovibrio bacteriovorus]BEV68347.1 Cysteine desulfuration protein SufE [Bdellovibrio bacteriovorus]CAE79811.1 Regulator of cysteine desulfurase activity [Bdellovibrio bacteriovorus HD100]
MTIQEKQNKVIQDFSALAQWEDRYKKIIDMGKALPEMPESLKTEQNVVKGCQSQVWLSASLNDQGQVHLQGDSDALIVKGLVGLLLNVYSGATPSEILATPPEFLKALGFEGNLSPSRANGLHSMLKQIKLYATAFDYLLKTKK